MNINGKDIKSLDEYMNFLSKNAAKWKQREKNKKYFIDQLKKGKSFKKKIITNKNKLF